MGVRDSARACACVQAQTGGGRGRTRMTVQQALLQGYTHRRTATQYCMHTNRFIVVSKEAKRDLSRGHRNVTADGAHVLLTNNANVAVIAPILAPRVLDEPELLPCGLVSAVSRNENGMIDIFTTGTTVQDTAGIIAESVAACRKSAAERSVLQGLDQDWAAASHAVNVVDYTTAITVMAES